MHSPLTLKVLLSLDKLASLCILTRKQILIEAKESIFSGDQRDFDTVASWKVGHLALISGLIGLDRLVI